jgi:hypothetical protein
MGSSQSRAQCRVESLRRDALNRYSTRLLAAGFREDTEFAKRQGKLSLTRRFYKDGFGAINTRVFATQELNSIDTSNLIYISTATRSDELTGIFQRSVSGFTDTRPLFVSRCASASEVLAMVPVEDMHVAQQDEAGGSLKPIYATLVAIEGLPTFAIMWDQASGSWGHDPEKLVLQIQHDPSVQTI